MQKKGKGQKPVELVRKPILPGSWHGRDAWKLALKRAGSVLAITLLYLISCALLSFESLWMRVLFSLSVVAAVAFYQYAGGVTQGAADAAYGEIIYTRREAGYEVPPQECERSFHRAKGLFAVLVGSLPFVLFACVFACMTEKVVYQLGVLPSWTESMMTQSEFAAPLAYYSAQSDMSAMHVMRVIDRALVMPFVNISSYFGADATLLVERLSPLLVLIAPMGYAVGYTMGQKQRDQVNTGIKLGDDKKKRKERKARKQRQRSSAPERLI